MKAQRARVGGQLQPAMAQVVVHLVAHHDGPGFVPDALAKALHLLRRRAAVAGCRYRPNRAQLMLELVEQFAELRAQHRLSQLQAATGAA